MTFKPGLTFVGLLAGIGLAAWLIKRQEEEPDVSLFDQIGDLFVQLTTTEEGRIAKLQPEVQAQLRALLGDLYSAGVPVEVGATLRTSAREKALIAEGKTSASLTVSWHQLGRAVDMYPIDNDGYVVRELRKDRLEVDIALFRRMHEIAKANGWRGIAFNDDGTRHFITNSAGKKVWDGGHIEWRSPYDTIAQAVAAEGAQYGLA